MVWEVRCVQRVSAKIAPFLNFEKFMAIRGGIELPGEDPGGSGDGGPGATAGGAVVPFREGGDVGLGEELLAAAVGALEFFAAFAFAFAGEAQGFG